ncbi:winged helix-turn-helix transcriptional regulator [Spirosoma taeanense]|uniref:Winged helix-turn-helix transcriptional regulator n=2 Tax=Spirosoma taeanense TaxID=2735870 RepID=A0A6M5YEM4_9BACT|nr:winged helix-turn-helix transcriptional regulator [Spirosoma taeanense]
MDYSSTFQFLDTARQYAQATSKGPEYQAFISAQEALLYFDIHNYTKSERLMKAIEKTGFRYIDMENRAKLVMQQGYLLYRRKRYLQAEKTYDQAISLLKASSPCDLPMIYVKKMQLYSALNNKAKMLEALRLSSLYADSCKIIKYHIYAYSELLAIYEQRDDIVGIAFAAKRLDSLNTLYAQSENVAKLHTQKEKILLKAKDQRLAEKQQFNIVLLTIVLGLILLVAVLIFLLKAYRKQQPVIVVDNNPKRAELKTYMLHQQEKSQESVSTIANKNVPLSDRQREVLTYMAAGLTNKEIADKLFISENTVKYHIKNIYQILELKDRKDLLVTLSNIKKEQSRS